jgi:hypothetical protein
MASSRMRNTEPVTLRLEGTSTAPLARACRGSGRTDSHGSEQRSVPLTLKKRPLMKMKMVAAMAAMVALLGNAHGAEK